MSAPLLGLRVVVKKFVIFTFDHLAIDRSVNYIIVLNHGVRIQQRSSDHIR